VLLLCTPVLCFDFLLKWNLYALVLVSYTLFVWRDWRRDQEEEEEGKGRERGKRWALRQMCEVSTSSSR
jgi:hypothetical protein